MVTNDQMNSALAALWNRRPTYAVYERYLEGDHPLGFATDKFRNAFGTLFKAFADNQCPVVIEAATSNLSIIGFTTEGKDESQKSLAEMAWTIWKTLRMSQLADDAHHDALNYGDSYVIVWPGDPFPRVDVNPPWLVTVVYDEDDPSRLIWAAKVWKPDPAKENWYLTFYYPDRVEKFSYRGSGPPKVERLTPREIDNEPWPLPHDFGRVPVVHLRNGGRKGGFGRSILKPVIPLQDALNKAIADMLVSMEYVALPQRWATGLEVEFDPETGKPKNTPFTPGIDRVWAVGAPDARFGQFDSASLQQFLAVQDGFRLEIARVSGTPLHYLMLDDRQIPSGEALKVLQDRFVQKSLKRQEVFGNNWEDVMLLVLSAAAVPLPATPMLSATWQDPSPSGEKEMVEISYLKKQIGVSRRQLLQELGYTIDEIEKMEQENQSELSTLGEELLREFEHGADE